MNVEIIAPDLGGFDSNQDLVYKVLDKFDKYLHDYPDGTIFARVALRPDSSDSRTIYSKIDLSIPDVPEVIADGIGENKLKALNAAADQVERQLRDLKEKRTFPN